MPERHLRGLGVTSVEQFIGSLSAGPDGFPLARIAIVATNSLCVITPGLRFVVSSKMLSALNY